MLRSWVMPTIISATARASRKSRNFRLHPMIQRIMAPDLLAQSISTSWNDSLLSLCSLMSVMRCLRSIGTKTHDKPRNRGTFRVPFSSMRNQNWMRLPSLGVFLFPLWWDREPTRKGEAKGLFSVSFAQFPSCLGLFVEGNRNAHPKKGPLRRCALNGAVATHLSRTLLY